VPQNESIYFQSVANPSGSRLNSNMAGNLSMLVLVSFFGFAVWEYWRSLGPVPDDDRYPSPGSTAWKVAWVFSRVESNFPQRGRVPRSREFPAPNQMQAAEG
jgi:hypothetical protein